MTIKTYDSVEKMLQQVTKETPVSAVEQLHIAVESDARLAETDFIDDRREKYQRAKAVADSVGEMLSGLRRRIQETARKLEGSPASNALRALLFSAGSLACMVTEVTLSLSLPFLLDIQEHSFLGIMMGLAVASAVLILEYVAEKLGFQEGPWELLRSALPNRFWRVTACTASVAVLLAVTGLNLYTIRTQAPIREEAAKVRHNITAPDEPPIPVDEAKVSRAVFWFSMTVTIGAALLLVVGSTDLRRLYRRGALCLALRWLNKQEGQLVKEYNEAAAVLEARQVEWNRAPEDARHAADLVRSGHLFRLAQALTPRPKPSPLEIIDEIFRGHKASGAA